MKIVIGILLLFVLVACSREYNRVCRLKMHLTGYERVCERESK